MLFRTVIKNIRLHYPSQRSRSALSALPASQGDIFKAARFFGPREENNHRNTSRAHPWPLLTKRQAPGRNKLAGRCPSGIEVPGVLKVREEKNKWISPKGTSSFLSGSALPSQRLGSACLPMKPKHRVGSTRRCL